MMTFEEQVRLGILIYSDTEYNCAVCKEKSHWYDILWFAVICSDECEAHYHQEYIAYETKWLMQDKGEYNA